MNDLFHKVSVKIANRVGSSWAFLLAIVVIIVWALTGPIFNFSDTWQLVINTGTTIITFLMVFLIQNTQNRDAKAMQLKLDELLMANKSARNELVDLEDLSDREIQALDEDFKKLREQGLSKVTKALQEKVEKEKVRRKNKGLWAGIRKKFSNNSK